MSQKLFPTTVDKGGINRYRSSGFFVFSSSLNTSLLRRFPFWILTRSVQVGYVFRERCTKRMSAACPVKCSLETGRKPRHAPAITEKSVHWFKSSLMELWKAWDIDCDDLCITDAYLFERWPPVWSKLKKLDHLTCLNNGVLLLSPPLAPVVLGWKFGFTEASDIVLVDLDGNKPVHLGIYPGFLTLGSFCFSQSSFVASLFITPMTSPAAWHPFWNMNLFLKTQRPPQCRSLMGEAVSVQGQEAARVCHQLLFSWKSQQLSIHALGQRMVLLSQVMFLGYQRKDQASPSAWHLLKLKPNFRQKEQIW